MPPVINVSDITSQVSELSSITKLLRDELGVIGQAIADNANNQLSKTAELHEAVEKIKLGINKLWKMANECWVIRNSTPINLQHWQNKWMNWK